MKLKKSGIILGMLFSIAVNSGVLGYNKNTSIIDEFDASIIQSQIMKDCKKNNEKTIIKDKIKKVNSQIKQNEKEIKSLEKKREDLDLKLAVQLQRKEVANYSKIVWEINPKIKNIESKIKSNENSIKSLQQKRNDLDHDYAVLLQKKEILD